MSNKQNITCPTCGTQNTWRSENSFRPFCSARCKLIDLGEWASETRKIPGDPVEPSLSPFGNGSYDSEDHFNY